MFDIVEIKTVGSRRCLKIETINRFSWTKTKDIVYIINIAYLVKSRFTHAESHFYTSSGEKKNVKLLSLLFLKASYSLKQEL